MMRILFFRHINFEIQSTFVTVREVFVGKSFALFSKLYVRKLIRGRVMETVIFGMIHKIGIKVLHLFKTV